MPRTHLVTGVTGQDGVHLARALLAAGEHVVGTHLGPDPGPYGVYLDGVVLTPLDVRDDARFAALLEEHRPDVVHHLAALSSVGDSWTHRELTDEVDHRAVVRMLARLEAHAQRHGGAPRLLLASSSEVFGEAPAGSVLDAGAPLRPVSPYGEAKARAQEAVAQARERGLDAASLILFGHTSCLHAPRFVLRRIARLSAEVALGRAEAVTVRDPSVRRDWGSAPDLVRAFVAAAGVADLEDVVVATGVVHALGEVAGWAREAATRAVGGAAGTAADTGDAGLRSGGEEPSRPHDVTDVRGDPARAAAVLGWRPQVTLRDEIERMARVDVVRLRRGIEESVDLLA